MNQARVVDASVLPEGGSGTVSPVWWGTLGFMAVEGTSLMLSAATYLYLSRHSGQWAPTAAPLPDLAVPTAFLLCALASLIPAVALKRAGHRHDAGAIRRLLLFGVAVELLLVALRALEFRAMNTRWDTTAYGSIFWFVLGFHTTLLLADLLETGGFAALFWFGRIESKHYSDVEDVAVYWFFVVGTWVPLHALLYFFPRLG